ncbi:MAG: arylsulfatase [Saprospiraceae bacterium]|nr:arylsulfatase [Saprospiraceae bacterium]
MKNLAKALFIPLMGFFILTGCGPSEPTSRDNTSGNQIPKPDPAFGGKVGSTYEASVADFPKQLKAPAGAPNVLIILLDDVGFGMAGTFGGSVPTPNFDRLAQNGLKYNQFHTTALCSPTRGALLAGRNHHSIATGVIIEMGTGFPGYTGVIPKSTALVSQTLRDNGFATAMFGKWHNTPEPDISPAGPFDRWPTGLGFDYFYGFNQGETHQYYPTLYRNTVMVKQPKSPEQGYHFTTDMTDETINWINTVNAVDPERPWFSYYSTGAVHAPHHAPKAWRDKYKGKFDHGWDKEREIIFQRQLQMGIIPQGTKLTSRPGEIPSWETQSPEARKVYARLMENYAAFMAHTDDEVGRLLDALETSGELDNTLIFCILGDNGASAEGGLEGTFSEVASLLGIQLGLESTLSRIDEIGDPGSEPHVPVGWAWAMNTPFQWTKQIASHYGGTRNPLIVHWPKGIKAKNEMRSQWHHVIDVVPTILEACGVQQPDYVNGIRQKPLEGISMLYTFDNAGAKDARTLQYFELAGNRALYKDGWVACTRSGVPWETLGKTNDMLGKATWELYHVAEDFSQANDLAATHPDKLRELQQAFEVEAKKYDVFPLDARFSERMNPALRASGPPKTAWTYYGNNVQVPEPIGPQLFPRPLTIDAEVVVPEKGAEGVITCAGAFSAGWSLYVLNNKPVFKYNAFEVAELRLAGKSALPKGKITVGIRFTPDGSPTGGGNVQLLVNGQVAAEGKIGRTMVRHGLEPFEVGRDTGTPVDHAYAQKGEFAFTGGINKVSFKVQ